MAISALCATGCGPSIEPPFFERSLPQRSRRTWTNGLGEETIEVLRAAAPLHDVAEIGISDSIMSNAGPLTPEEFEMMKLHVRIGASILGTSSEPPFHVAAQIAVAPGAGSPFDPGVVAAFVTIDPTLLVADAPANELVVS